MTEQEKDKYLGHWNNYDSLFREIVVGDLIMMETFDDVLVVEVHRIDDTGTLWHHNGWIIPRKQIIAVREDIL